MVVDTLLPLEIFVPDMTPRARAERARGGAFPGARRVGRRWFWTRGLYEAWLGGTCPAPAQAPPSVDDAVATLRRHGVGT